ncbi:MAG TPA: hypothetical protein DCM86_02055, partial [Verrucomicrobiales bacterium]|nr:hypothetical protein [Verrucomicrobiales bacterium]
MRTPLEVLLGGCQDGLRRTAARWLPPLLCLGPVGLAAAEPQHRPLSLVDCVHSALEHNYDLKIARFNPAISSNDLHQAFADYDPVFTLGGDHGYNRQPEVRDASGSGANGLTTTSDGFTAGLSGSLPTGGSLSLATALT